MDGNQFYPSKWLSAEDVVTGETVQVTGFKSEIFKDIAKPVIEISSMSKVLKPMILNKTNHKKMMELFGSETDNWPGNGIILDIVTQNTPDGPKPGIIIVDKVK